MGKRYGAFKYGDGTKYGASVTGILKWSVEIDWDQDLRFDGSNEARRMFSIHVNRGRKAKLRLTGSGFQTIPTGTCTIKLRNNDGRYDGWNQSSPLYPYVIYGPEVRIRVTNQETGVRKDFFAGKIVDIRPYGYGRNAYVEIKIEDFSRFLRSYRARTPVAQGLTPGEAISAILDDVNWPAGTADLLVQVLRRLTSTGQAGTPWHGARSKMWRSHFLASSLLMRQGARSSKTGTRRPNL
jgi:hypothetical protein